LSFDLSGFKESFKEFGFSFDEIQGLMKMFDPDSSGICGSLVFRHLARMFGKNVSTWTPSDIDFCVTKQKDYDFVKKHFKDQGCQVIDSFAPTSRYSDSMADVVRVCEIYPKDASTFAKHLQVILVRPDDGGGLVSHLKQVDLDVTRVAYTTRGFIGVGNALESIAAGESSFPTIFRNSRCLNKTFRRSVKYSKERGVKINYPKYINYTPYSIWSVGSYSIWSVGSLSSRVTDVYARYSSGTLVLKSARAEDVKKRSEKLASERVKELTEEVETQKKKIADLEAAVEDEYSDDEDYDELVEKVGGYKAKMAMILSIVNSEAAEEVEKLKKKLESTKLLKTEHEKALASLKTEHEAAMASLKAEHEKSLTSFKTDHEASLASLKSFQKELESKHEAKLSDVSAKLTVAVDDLTQLQEKVTSQKKQLDTEVDHSKALQQENRDLTAKVKDLEDKLQTKVDNVVKLQQDYHEASKKLDASTAKFEALRKSILEHVSDE
jgi:uncharacterized protein YaaQ